MIYFFAELNLKFQKHDHESNKIEILRLMCKAVKFKNQLASNRSTSIRDASADMEDDEPKSDVLRVLTSACSCRQYSSLRSLSLRS